MTARHLVVGPTRHGVVLHATRLASADSMLAARTVTHPSCESGQAPEALSRAAGSASSIFVHVTDRLFGSTPEEAAEVIGALAARWPMGMSLHDVPQPAEGDAWYQRRRAAYREFALLATALVVASDFELRSLVRCLDEGDDATSVVARTTVIPLPLERLPMAGPPPTSDSFEVAVLGYLYPGKGMEDVIDAVSRIQSPSRPVRVGNYGAPAEGHSDLVGQLAEQARRVGVQFHLTGYLPEDQLVGLLRSASVPVAPHRHISASGSVNSWVAAGRRPVLRNGGYAHELDTRLPGVVTLTDSLADAIAAALDDPSSTWQAPDVVVGPTWSHAAKAHLRVMASLP